MHEIDNIIFYRLSMNEENAVFDKYLKIPAPAHDAEALRTMAGDFIGDPQNGGNTKPPIEHHEHISKVQRDFSILVEPGNNMYIIGLDSIIDCKFGPNSPPIGLFSADYYRNIVTDITLQSDGLLSFVIDYDKSITGLRGAMVEFWSVRELDKKRHDDGPHPMSPEEIKNFAIPFFFNLYDKATGIPIWVLNDHDNSDHHVVKPLWHGKVHPNLNAYLVFE